MTEGQNKRPRSGAQALIPASAPVAQRPGFEDEMDEAIAKPDVFEYFAQRANRQKELQQEVDRLKLRETTLSRQVQDTELQLSRMKAELTASAARHENREAQLELQRQQFESSLHREVERAAALEIQLKNAEAAQGSGGGAPPPGAAFAEPSALLDGPSAREYRLQITELELALEAATAEGEGAVRQLQAELQAEKHRREAETAIAEALRQRVHDAEAQDDASAAARRGAEAHAAALEAQMMQNQAAAAGRSTSEGDAVMIKSLREQLKAAEAAAAGAARLREQAASAVVLREKLEAAESRARLAEQMLEGEAAAHAELAETQAQLQRWNALFSTMAECSTPEDVLRMVRRLQDREVSAAAGAGDKAEELGAVRAEAEAAQAAALDAEGRAQAAETRANAAEGNLARLERRVKLLSQERDSLKSVLASYDEEYLTRQQDGGEISPAQRRIAELEATVEALHSHIRSLEGELGAGSVAAAGNADALAEAAAQVAAAEAQARAAQAEVENLEQQIALLEERVARGEYNPATTKVLHLRSNPEAELHRVAQESRIAELESENDALKSNVQRLEAAAGGGESGGLRVAQLEGEGNLLRRRLAEAQKAADRLQKVFTRQIATFRDAIKGLFGYAVEMSSDPNVKEFRAQFVLRPQFADEAGAELAFRMLPDGRIAFMKTEYATRRLSREVETFVERYKSIPAFTANLTMENFQRQTQS